MTSTRSVDPVYSVTNNVISDENVKQRARKISARQVILPSPWLARQQISCSPADDKLPDGY